MKTLKLSVLVLACACLCRGADDLKSKLQAGLFEEEANHNLPAAIAAYQAAVAQCDKDRELAATAIFRLGECYRKMEKTNEAVAFYQRIVREFPENATLVRLSQQNLGGREETPAGRTFGAIQEESELKRLQSLLKDSPDLINAASAAPTGSSTPLHGAVIRGQAAVVQFLIEHKADLEVKDASGRTALILAAENGQKSMVELLLAKGAFVQAADRAGGTALHTAARRGYRAVAEVLLAHKANINTVDTQGLTPLHLAAGQGFNSVVELLLDHRADLEALSDYSTSMRSGWMPAEVFGAPLQMAVRAGHKSTVELLLARKAKPNALNPRGLTPLHYAAAESAPAIAETLLRGGASVDVPASDKYGASAGWTPLHFAVARGTKEMVELLLTNKADPNLAIANACESYGEGYTALCMAVARKMEQNLVELLLAHGADPNVSSKSGTTPLKMATANGSQEMVELLLTHKADPNFQSKPQAWMPLLIAVDNRSPSLVELLLRFKASLNAQNEDGDTALHLLAKSSRNQRMRPGMPMFGGVPVAPPGVPVTGVVLAGPIDETTLALASLLLTNHANVNLRNGQGLTPLNVFGIPATPRNKTEEALIALLRQHGAKDALSELEPDPSVIRVWRRGQAKGDVVFTKDTNGLNSFTLMDTILGFYGLRNSSDPRVTASYGPGGAYAPAGWWHSSDNRIRDGYMAFPDLGKIQVGKFMEGRGYVTSPVNLLGSSTNLDCSSDVVLQFGDVVEIPEREHTLSEPAVGLTDPQHKQLLDCVPHKVWVIVKGKRHELLPAPGEGLYLSRALASPEALAILVSSSDLSRVKVQRHDPKTGAAERTLTNDLTAFRASGKPIFEDLVLYNGDVIEVSEKGEPFASRSVTAPVPSEQKAGKQSGASPSGAGWTKRADAPLSGRHSASGIWTGKEMIVFGGESPGVSRGDGARYDPASDKWTLLPPEPTLQRGRNSHSAVWTGQEMIIWGGFGGASGEEQQLFNTGARFNPATGEWKPVSTLGAPSARLNHAAVWTGQEMWIWGGYADARATYAGGYAPAHLDDGARYDPATGQWKPVSKLNAPSKRFGHTAVWTGRQVILWGGADAEKVMNDGCLYDPSNDSWSALPTENAPSPRFLHQAIWTGREMVVFGGVKRDWTTPAEDGARFNPETRQWTPIARTSRGTCYGMAVWSGREIVAWGGWTRDSSAKTPAAEDEKARTTRTPAGTMIIQGGSITIQNAREQTPGAPLSETTRFINTGACYDPATDTWTPLTTDGAPPPRSQGRPAVWTGDGMLSFGGWNGGQYFKDTWYYRVAKPDAQPLPTKPTRF